MRMNHPDIDPATAFPQFVLNYMNPWLGGVVLATLLIAAVGTGAGLALGISTIFTKDIYKNYINKGADDKKLLLISRWVIVLTLSLALLFITGNAKSLILKWSFMSMGLRGATVFAPLCGALFMTGKVKSSYAVASMVIGPLAVLLGKSILPEEIDPLFLGAAASFLLVAAGAYITKHDHNIENKSAL